MCCVAVRTALELQSSPQLKARTVPELVNLIYRDDIHQKHANKRLRKEIATAKSQQPQPPAPPPTEAK